MERFVSKEKKNRVCGFYSLVLEYFRVEIMVRVAVE